MYSNVLTFVQFQLSSNQNCLKISFPVTYLSEFLRKLVLVPVVLKINILNAHNARLYLLYLSVIFGKRKIIYQSC